MFAFFFFPLTLLTRTCLCAFFHFKWIYRRIFTHFYNLAHQCLHLMYGIFMIQYIKINTSSLNVAKHNCETTTTRDERRKKKQQREICLLPSFDESSTNLLATLHCLPCKQRRTTLVCVLFMMLAVKSKAYEKKKICLKTE